MPVATHIPLELEDTGNQIKLLGHVSLANKQHEVLREHPQVLVIFTGPHAYISSSWYAKPNVPTWNYQAVHAYGKARLQTPEELHHSLIQLVDRYEKDSDRPVSVQGLPQGYVEGQIRGIVGIEVEVDRLEASFKLSQNRTDEDYAEIIRQLEKRGDHGSIDVAQAMRDRVKNKH